jgi:aspartyl-tRNA(Asn)/glutamyl-tRNA(Gln) amidotransferase subunit A
MLLQEIVGYDDRESTSVRAPGTDYVKSMRQSTRSLRVGLPRTVFFQNLESEIDELVAAAIRVIEKLVARVRDVVLPETPNSTIVGSEVYARHSSLFEKNPGTFHPAIRQRLQRGSTIPASTYVRDRRDQDQLRQNTGILFPDVDVLVTPIVGTAAITVDEALIAEPVSNANLRPFNTYGVPAISVPCGFTRSGAATGIQIVGRPFMDTSVLALARAYEQATNWHHKHPAL